MNWDILPHLQKCKLFRHPVQYASWRKDFFVSFHMVCFLLVFTHAVICPGFAIKDFFGRYGRDDIKEEQPRGQGLISKICIPCNHRCLWMGSLWLLLDYRREEGSLKRCLFEPYRYGHLYRCRCCSDQLVDHPQHEDSEQEQAQELADRRRGTVCDR